MNQCHSELDEESNTTDYVEKILRMAAPRNGLDCG